jgi:SAM-dependent methyltransferase
LKRTRPPSELPKSRPDSSGSAFGGRREQLRTTFGEVPELYDKARPLYPLQIFDDLIALANLAEGSRVVEIGPGTGQATSELAKRGLRVTGVELSEELATIARRKLGGDRSVEIVTADFEEWTPAAADFDAIVAVTAFHWIDPRSRYERSARLLRTNGSLAVIANRHVLPDGSDQFWVDVQSDYDAVVPSESNSLPPHPDLVADLGAEIEASGLFRNVAGRRYLWDVTYTADAYIDVLNTFSGHRAIPDSKRAELFNRIRRRIESQPHGVVTKTLLSTLNVARRL